MYHVPGAVVDPEKPPVFTQLVPVGTTMLGPTTGGTVGKGEGVPLRVRGGVGVPVKVGVRVREGVPVDDGLEPNEGEGVEDEDSDGVGVAER